MSDAPTLEQLADQVAALAAEIGTDVGSIGANYLTTDAQGRVTAVFAGHVQAKGIDLEEATVTGPVEDNRVRWLQQSDGSYVAGLYAQNLGTGKHGLFAELPGTATDGAKIIDTDGRSAFMRIVGTRLGASDVGPMVAWGRATATWTVGGAQSDIRNVIHGLGQVPVAVVAVPTTVSTDAHRPFTLNVGTTLNVNLFQVDVTAQGAAMAAGDTRDFFWIAIG